MKMPEASNENFQDPACIGIVLGAGLAIVGAIVAKSGSGGPKSETSPKGKNPPGNRTRR